MKTIYLSCGLLIISLLLNTDALAQKKDTTHVETIFGNKNLEAKLYGSLQIGKSSMKHANLLQSAAGIGINLKKRFSIGVQANGIFRSGKVEEIYYAKYGDTYTALVKAYYGGVKFEYKTQPNKVGHLGFPLIIGGGKFIYQTDRKYYSGSGGGTRREIDSDIFNYIEPGVHFEINLSKVVKIGFLLSYRITSLEIVSTLPNEFNAVCMNFELLFCEY